jgi:hypothetical protein
MKLNWKLLREQKQALREVIAETPAVALEEHLTGILHLIDGLQDEAIEDGEEQAVVFGPDPEDAEPELPAEARCTNCGVSDFSLARDSTDYSTCDWDTEAKLFRATHINTENSSAEDAVRFFCASCGTQHPVPEECK